MKSERTQFNLPVSFTYEQIEKIREDARKENKQLAAYVKEKLGIEDEIQGTLNEALNRALRQNKGAIFAVPQLFTPEEWNSKDQKNKIRVGREFYKVVGSIEKYKKEIRICDKINNLQVYQKIN